MIAAATVCSEEIEESAPTRRISRNSSHSRRRSSRRGRSALQLPVAFARPQRTRPDAGAHDHGGDAERDRIGERRAADAERRERSPAERECARKGDLHQRRRGERRRRDGGVAPAAQGSGEGVGEPDENRAAEKHAGIGVRLRERAAGTSEKRVQRPAGGEENEAEGDPDGESDGERVHGQTTGRRLVARAAGAGDGRRHAAAHGAGRRHLQQHHQREDERQAGERLGAQPADEMRVGDRDRGLESRESEARRRKPGDRSEDRRWRAYLHISESCRGTR
jgi:hypothetical protein